ncbi:MAG: hypothetical protein K2M91_15600 [Lachnospiraceae bacterium]|nr:hypothetical protein [Lachnospiraceae bacterium]
MKNVNHPHTNQIPEPTLVIQKVIDFLLLFIPKILGKRVVAIILLAADVPVPRVIELSGVCDRTVRGLLKSLKEGQTDSLFIIRSGSGSRSKTKGIENEILKEIENNNYHTQRQIADMIRDKFGITISLPAVARLLKKTVSNG